MEAGGYGTAGLASRRDRDHDIMSTMAPAPVVSRVAKAPKYRSDSQYEGLYQIPLSA
jgi:hypothetical protein